MKRFMLALVIALALSWTAAVRTDGFSLAKIGAPLHAKVSPPINPAARRTLSQPFHYLGKGRQCFVFESQDGQCVLKFFNQKYLQMPWYSFLVEKKERAKRSRRLHFYENSYEIALHEFGAEILYLHLGPSDDLPEIALADQASRRFKIDLNRVPFVLQKKGEPVYSCLDDVYNKEGVEGLHRHIDGFLAAVSGRIAKKIADADSDVEHNWGYVEGKLFHLDPGRLYYDASLEEPDRRRQEWRSATHGLRKWLKANYPEAADYLDARIKSIIC